MGQMASFIEGKNDNLPSTSEVNPKGVGVEHCKANTLRSGGEIEEVNEKEEVEQSIEQLKDEEESTSLESEEKNEEVEIISEMTPWAYVKEKLPSEDIPYIFGNGGGHNTID